jgi:hypothetical protein
MTDRYGAQEPQREAEDSPSTPLGSLAEHAGLSSDADAGQIAPLLASYTGRIRALAPRDVLAGGPAVTFNASWDDE